MRYLFHGLVLLWGKCLDISFPRVYITPEASPFHIIYFTLSCDKIILISQFHPLTTGLYSLLDSMNNIRSRQQFRLSFCFLCKLHLFLLAFVSFFLFHSLTYGAELKEEKRVLILFSNQSDLPAYPMVEKGIKSSLDAGHEFHLEYFIEYMDYYRNPN